MKQTYQRRHRARKETANEAEEEEDRELSRVWARVT